MKFYCILSKKKLYIIIAVLTVALFIIGKVYSDKASVIDGSTHQKRIAFLKGISEIDKAIDAPIIDAISGEQSWSTDKTVATILTSFL